MCDKDNPCPFDTYCVCEVPWPIPLPPSSPSKDVQFCSNPQKECFWPQVQPMPPPPITTTTPAPAPGGKGVGETCGNSGDCQDGLKCYKPPGDKVNDFSGASKYCVQMCDKDNPCPFDTYCVCEVPWPIPLPPSSPSKDVLFCSNPLPISAVPSSLCFWPQIHAMPPPPFTTTTPALDRF